jgi:HSP20 family protein
VAPTRVSPFQDFAPIWDAMDRFISDGFNPRSWSTWRSGGLTTLPLEVYETPDTFVVRAVAPGVKPDDLTVEYDNGVLTIGGKVEAPETNEGWKVHFSEFPYGQFVRQVTLPRSIEIEQAQSNFEHGVLTLVLPKAAGARPKKIEITTPGQLTSGAKS